MKQDLIQTLDAYSGMTRLLKHPAASISSLIFGLALNRSLAITPLELLIAFTRFLARFELIFHKTLYGSNCISPMLQNDLWKLLMTQLNAEINTHWVSKASDIIGGLRLHLSKWKQKTATVCYSQTSSSISILSPSCHSLLWNANTHTVTHTDIRVDFIRIKKKKDELFRFFLSSSSFLILF